MYAVKKTIKVITVGRSGTSDGAVSHVANRNVFQTVDVEVVSTSSSRTELNFNCVGKDTAAVLGKVRCADSNTDRAWSISCNTENQLNSIGFLGKRLLTLSTYSRYTNNCIHLSKFIVRSIN